MFMSEVKFYGGFCAVLFVGWVQELLSLLDAVDEAMNR